jgi:multidrug efflux system membrane fusion protein
MAPTYLGNTPKIHITVEVTPKDTYMIHHRHITVSLLAVSFGLAGAIGPIACRAQDSTGAKSIELQSAILKTIQVAAIAAEVQGAVKEIHVEEGSRVSSGDVLARVHDTNSRLMLRKAEVILSQAKQKKTSEIDIHLAEKSVAVAEAELNHVINANKELEGVYAAKEVRRLKLVYERNLLELQRAKFARDLLDFEIDTAQIEVDSLKETIRKHQVTSPFNGVVISVDRKVGEWVDPGTTVVQIVEIGRLRIEGFVPASQAKQELIGHEATLVVDLGEGNSLSRGAKVTFVDFETNPLNNQVRVYLTVSNEDGKLRPGLTPTVIISR